MNVPVICSRHVTFHWGLVNLRRGMNAQSRLGRGWGGADSRRSEAEEDSLVSTECRKQGMYNEPQAERGRSEIRGYAGDPCSYE